MIHTYVCLVHDDRKFLQGEDRYLVGAKSETEAKEMLSGRLGIGTVNIDYQATDTNGDLIAPHLDTKMEYKQISRG